MKKQDRVEFFNKLCPKCEFSVVREDAIHCRHPVKRSLYIQWWNASKPDDCKYFTPEQLNLFNQTMEV